MRTMGVAITTYEREALALASFRQVVDDPRVSEVTIVDDRSDAALFSRLTSATAQWPKVRVHQNDCNLGCYLNKRQSVERSSSPWVLLLDSDNEIDCEFVDTLCGLPTWDPETLYLPVMGRPSLDYRTYEGMVVTQKNVSMWIDYPSFPMALNTGNFFVQRDAYLRVFDPCFDPSAADSLYFVACWLASGRRAVFTPGLHYRHLIHDGYWMQHAERSAQVAQELVQKLREMPCVA